MRKTVLIRLAAILTLTLGPQAQAVPYAYVANSTGETLSKINLQTGAVANDVLPLGSDVQSYANQIVVRDTLAYIVCSGTNEVQVINLKTETTVDFIPFAPGSNPYFMTIYNDQYAFVTNLTDNSVATLDLTTNAVVDVDSVGVSPSGIAIHNHNVWVVLSNYNFNTFSTQDGFVAVCSPLNDTIYTVIPVGHNPQFIAIDRFNVAHIVCTGDYGAITGMVYRINALTYAVIDSIPVGGAPGSIALSPSGVAYIAAGGWVTNGYVYTYDAVTGAVFHNSSNPLAVTIGATALTPYQDSSVFMVSFNDVIDRIDSSGALIQGYGVGDGPVGLDINYLPGDVDGNFALNVLDLNYHVAWMFNGGPKPVYPVWRGNVNGDYTSNVLDLNYLVAYFFGGGANPKPGSSWVQ